MNIKKTPLLCALGVVLAAALMLSGCLSPSQSGNTFSSSQTRTAQTVQFGTITSLNTAVIDNDASGLGALGGAVIGGVAGSTIGGGRGRTLTTLGGAVLGGAAGHGVERAVSKRDALEITVRMEDNGKNISIVQQLGEEERSFRVGERVRVLRSSDGSARVRR